MRVQVLKSSESARPDVQCGMAMVAKQDRGRFKSHISPMYCTDSISMGYNGSKLHSAKCRLQEEGAERCSTGAPQRAQHHLVVLGRQQLAGQRHALLCQGLRLHRRVPVDDTRPVCWHFGACLQRGWRWNVDLLILSLYVVAKDGWRAERLKSGAPDVQQGAVGVQVRQQLVLHARRAQQGGLLLVQRERQRPVASLQTIISQRNNGLLDDVSDSHVLPVSTTAT